MPRVKLRARLPHRMAIRSPRRQAGTSAAPAPCERFQQQLAAARRAAEDSLRRSGESLWPQQAQTPEVQAWVAGLLESVSLPYDDLFASLFVSLECAVGQRAAAEQRVRDLEAILRLQAAAATSSPAPAAQQPATVPLTSASSVPPDAGTSSAAPAAQHVETPAPTMAAGPTPSSPGNVPAPAAQQQQQQSAAQPQRQRGARRRGVRAGARVQARRAARQEQASAPSAAGPSICHPTALASVERMLADTVRAVLGAGSAQYAPAAASRPRRRAARPPAARAPAVPGPRPPEDSTSASDTDMGVAPTPGRLHRILIKRRRDDRSASSAPASLSGVSSPRQQASPVRMPVV